MFYLQRTILSHMRQILSVILAATLAGACEQPPLPTAPDPAVGSYVLDSVNLQPPPQVVAGNTVFGAVIILKADRTFSQSIDQALANSPRDTFELAGTWERIGASFIVLHSGPASSTGRVYADGTRTGLRTVLVSTKGRNSVTGLEW
ncbi:MAG TPA: hypothetical protein VFT29_10525 [Gemmatimonadaceae bacterium]|nr:hypothetical protein [Gemmatimonadaceae bacterium]